MHAWCCKWLAQEKKAAKAVEMDPTLKQLRAKLGEEERKRQREAAKLTGDTAPARFFSARCNPFQCSRVPGYVRSVSI